jgi:diguanylate cyclase (GGDEF)-like protein
MQRLAPRARRWLLGRRVGSPARARPSAAARPAWLVTLVLGSTVAGGALLVAWSLAESQRRQLGLDLLPLAALVVVAELLRVQVYEANRQRIELSFSIAVIMGAVTLNPAGTPLVGLAAAATHVVMTRQRRADKALFNLANVPLAAAAAAGGYAALGPPPGSFGLLHLGAALAAVLAYYGVNIGLIALMVSLHAGRPLLQVLREAAWFGPANVLLGLTGAFVGSVQAQLGWIGSLMFTVPLLLLRFTLAFHARMSRETIRTLERQARYDDLTGLPNRTCLHERLGEMVARSGEGEARFALLLLDLDRFKEVNDTFGHHHGDLLLEQVSVRLRGVLRSQDTVARLGGDEFALLLPAADAAGAYRMAEQVRRALVRPYVVEGYRLEVDASIGIALYPEHGRDADTLLRRADVAMYIAKRAGSGAALYAAELDQHHPSRLALIADLRQAIEQDQLLLHFQPKVAARDGRFVGVEALVRWRHPERGFVPPDQFIPLAEQTGLIQPLSRWVVNAALRQARAWQELGLRVPVAVNLSVRNLSACSSPTCSPSCWRSTASRPTGSGSRSPRAC